MVNQNGTALLRRHVGRWLTVLRQRAGYSQDTAAIALQRGSSSIWRLEAGDPRVRFRDSDTVAMCELYQASPETRERIRAFIGEIIHHDPGKHWWHDYTDGLPHDAGLYPSYERNSIIIHRYEQDLIPDLLQTMEYAEAVLRAPAGYLDDIEVERRLTHLRQRQALLTTANPPLLRLIVNESALRRTIGGTTTMVAQLEHLLAMANQPAISVRVLPFDAGAHAGMTNAFTGALYLDQPQHIAAYQQAWWDLDSRAHDEATTRRIITAAIAQHANVDSVDSVSRC